MAGKKAPATKQPRASGNGKHVGWEEFVTLWQKAPTFEDVMKSTGLSKASAYNRARLARKNGVLLKKFPGHREKPDWNNLFDVAKEALPS